MNNYRTTRQTQSGHSPDGTTGIGTESNEIPSGGKTCCERRNIALLVALRQNILQVYGVLPGHKDDGIIRLLYENANGIPNRLGGNEKLDKA